MLIGRQSEQEALRNAYSDEYSQLIVIYGRRRIGKTFLVRETFNYRFTFQHAGVNLGSKQEQLLAFSASLKDAGMEVKQKPRNWMEAFELLKDLIRQSKDERKVIFIDELSWMDTHKSDLLKSLESFWNGWASARKDIVLILCTSVTSWMLNKVIHNKGGLYHRVTLQIDLQPFSLYECESFSNAMRLGMRRFQILQAYMILGGVPYYWSFLKPGLSLPQNIDAMFFSPRAELKDEFEHLMSSLFRAPEDYVRIIQTLANRRNGMTRADIAGAAGLTQSGHLSEKLEELEKCGFIRVYDPLFNQKKGSIYQLIDPFIIFHYHFLITKNKDPHFWSNQINTPRLNTWNGLSFERVCLLHTEQIRRALGISGVLTNICSWTCREDAELGIHGSQIDLLLERSDQVINLMEMKFASTKYSVTSRVYEDLERKRTDLYTFTKTSAAIHLTMVTPFGLADNSFAKDIQSNVTMDHLFAEP